MLNVVLNTSIRWYFDMVFKKRLFGCAPSILKLPTCCLSRALLSREEFAGGPGVSLNKVGAIKYTSDGWGKMNFSP